MLKSLKKIAKDNRGQSMIEYALIIALIAVVVIAAVTALGGKVTNVFQAITDALPG
jgi:pilus assembly protein Flp/PilA